MLHLPSFILVSASATIYPDESDFAVNGFEAAFTVVAAIDKANAPLTAKAKAFVVVFMVVSFKFSE